MPTPTSYTLRVPARSGVPAAELYFEVAGAGPTLLLIPGGDGDAGPFGPLARQLADRYTVVSYDRRGFSRSRLDGPPVDGPPVDGHRLAADVADAVALFDEVGDGTGYVLGSSSGAIVGLHLLATHANRVHTLVAHEPPLLTLLPDAPVRLAFLDRVHDIYRRDGADPAMRVFFAGIGQDTPQLATREDLPAPVLEMLTRMRANNEFFLQHELRQYTRLVPDLTALAGVADRLVLAGGREVRDRLPYLPSTVLAERLGRAVLDFPGGHVGYVTHPAEFAAQLAGVFAERVSAGRALAG